ncbi:MAG: HAD family hydrolase [Gammaproteobacteria bacterium]|nr:HAD family hydrolase [Gammaproteobacteria bacterium]MDH5731758.1 HAD family hydrolase [Gammaproteobacteria bacterium]
MIKTVVFDVDDTLFPESSFVDSGFRAVSDFVRSEYAVDGFYEEAMLLFQQGSRGRIFNKVLEKLKILSDDLVRQLIDVYREHEPDIHLFKDARHILPLLVEKYNLAIITDGYFNVQRKKVKALKISHYFQKIIYTDEHGKHNWKPSEFAYLKVQNEFFSEGKECVYIGDNPSKDFVSPNKLGWLSIQIVRSESEYGHLVAAKDGEAQYRLHSLMELPSLLIEQNS